MRTFLTFLFGGLLGLIIGGLLVLYLFGGAPSAVKSPSAPIKPPDANGSPAGTAQVILNQQFFDQILTTIFRDLNAPAFPLNLTGQNRIAPSDSEIQTFAHFQENACDNKITVKTEGSNVTTGVRFDNNQITAPLAFNGKTSFAGQCFEFNGWAQTALELRYNEADQAVQGELVVQTVNLDGYSPVLGTFLTPVIQQTLKQRVNPIPILRGEQIALNLPIQASNGNLNAKVKDVRSEIKDNALHLFVTYDFSGVKN